MKIARVLLLLLGLVDVSGCGGSPVANVFSDSGIDSMRDAQGNVILLDTPRMWRDFVQTTEIAIKNERTGRNYGPRSSNDEWLRVIQHIKLRNEHPQKYIDYIIEQRRRAGLPELVGYP